MWGSVLRVHLEDRTLEILDSVALAVDSAYLFYLAGNRVALLVEAAVLVPVRQERPLNQLSSSGKSEGGGLGERCGSMTAPQGSGLGEFINSSP